MILSKNFIEVLYEAAHIQRWNDHIIPQGFTELDKQAHKMVILYVLSRYEEQDHGARPARVGVNGEGQRRLSLTSGNAFFSPVTSGSCVQWDQNSAEPGARG